MKTMKLRLDDALAERLDKTATLIGYSSAEEFALNVLVREMDKLAPEEGESEEDIRRKLEGLGYMA